jgi:mRNA interferase HigB
MRQRFRIPQIALYPETAADIVSLSGCLPPTDYNLAVRKVGTRNPWNVAIPVLWILSADCSSAYKLLGEPVKPTLFPPHPCTSLSLSNRAGCSRLPNANELLDPNMGTCYFVSMRIISRKTLKEFWERRPEAQQALQAWHADVKQAAWKSPADVKSVYRNASIVANNRVVFNIKGNTYRLVAAIQYEFGIVYIRFVGTHHEYGQIDAATV